MTNSDRILLAAADLDRDAETFTVEELAVRAHRLNPGVFCLAGYPQYVGTHRVYPKVQGSVGLIARGMLEQIATRTLRITPAGRKRARAIAARSAA